MNKINNPPKSIHKPYEARIKLLNRLFAVVLMGIFGVVGVIALNSSSAASVSVTGRVYDTRTGNGVPGVKIYGCSSHNVTFGPVYTNSSGNWSFSVPIGYYYCARVTGGIPSGWSGPKTTNNRPQHVNSSTYENQVAGMNCYQSTSSACNSYARTWDKATDSNTNFTLTSPAPPPPTSISSFTASPLTITAGQSSTLSWRSNGSGCTLKGGSTNLSTGGDSSVKVSPKTTTAYTLTCSGGGGSASRGLTVTVKSTTGSGGGSGNNGGSGGSGGTSGSSSNSSPSKPKDKTPPSTPGSFKATINKDSQTIELSWSASKDNVKVSNYELDRSEDNLSWEVLSTGLTSTGYTDQTANFGVKYYYRVKAVDSSGNSSKYATTTAALDSFQANTSKDSDTSIVSDDNVVSVLIPAGALDSDAFCSLVTPEDVLPPSFGGYKFISGPYSLICRDANSNTITGFNKPLVLTAQVDKGAMSGVKQIQYFGQKDDGSWNQLKIIQHDKSTLKDTVDPGSTLTYVVMGKLKKGSVWVTIFKILLFIAIIILILRFIVGRLLKRKAEAQYEDYLRKSEGL